MNLPELPQGEWADHLDPFTKVYTADQLRSYAEEAVKQEREACAALCEERAGTMSMFGSVKDARAHNAIVHGCAQAIRARTAVPAKE